MASFILYAFAFVLAVNTGCALKCYSCDSMVSTSCIDAFNYFKEECSGPSRDVDSLYKDKCYKLTAKNKKGEELVARGCLDQSISQCSAIAKNIGWITAAWYSDPGTVTDLNCTTCENDQCNSAFTNTGLRFIALLFAVFAFLF